MMKAEKATGGVCTDVILEPCVYSQMLEEWDMMSSWMTNLFTGDYFTECMRWGGRQKERVKGTGQVINSYKWRQWKRLANSQARKLIPFHGLNEGLWLQDCKLTASLLDGSPNECFVGDGDAVGTTLTPDLLPWLVKALAQMRFKQSRSSHMQTFDIKQSALDTSVCWSISLIIIKCARSSLKKVPRID
jgi:hypothetical protein